MFRGGGKNHHNPGSKRADIFGKKSRFIQIHQKWQIQTVAVKVIIAPTTTSGPANFDSVGQLRIDKATLD